MGPGAGERLYRLLLRAFPRDFRRRFGRELEGLFEARRREAKEAGLPAVALLWIRTVPTVVWNGVAERWTTSAGATGGFGVREATRTARSLWRSPRYLATTAITYALVIGTATVYAALADGVLFRPLPYPESERLLFVGYAGEEGSPTVASAYALTRLRDAASLDGVAWFGTYVGTMTGAGEPVRLSLTHASDDFFDVVGVRPVLGRGFLPGESGTGSAGVVVLSHGLWADRFGADPDALGRTVLLDGAPREIVGVMPEGFAGPDDLFRSRSTPETDLWLPYPDDPLEQGPAYWTVRGVARLVPGATLERARSEASGVASGLRSEHPESFPERGFALLPMQEAVLGPQGLRILALLGGAVFLALLVGCANVANLAMARRVARADARAIRSALGARASHHLFDLAAEVLWLALAGGLAGVALAWVGTKMLVAGAPALPLVDQVRVDLRVVSAAAGVTLLAALLGTLLPSVRIGRTDPTGFRGHGRTTPSRRWTRVQQAFAGFQVTAAVAILVGAFVLHDSLRSLLSVDPGFDQEGVRVVQVDLPTTRYDEADARVRFTDQATRALRERSGIDGVAFGSTAPQAGVNDFATRVQVEGREEEVVAYFRAVTPGWFGTLRTELLRGRPLEEADGRSGAPGAAVVNREFARRFLDGEGLGRRVGIFGQEGIEVVGVVEDVRYGSLARPAPPEVYLPWLGRFSTVFLVVSGRGPGDEVVAAVREEIHALDPTVPLDRIPTMSSLVARSVEVERFLRLLVTTLAGLVLSLAAVGMYGVLAEWVARRTRELAIRAALGADPGSLRRTVLGRAGTVVAAGAAGALPIAFLAVRATEGILFGVDATDPAPYVLGVAVATAVGLWAAWVPARRATRSDPVRVLREA